MGTTDEFVEGKFQRINPLEVTDWKTYVRLHILEKMVHRGKCFLNDLIDSLSIYEGAQKIIEFRFKHDLRIAEIEEIIQQMYTEGLIKMTDCRCGSCFGKTISPENVISHVLAFEITPAGLALIPENVPGPEESKA